MQVLYRSNLVLQHDAETTEWKVALIVFPFIWPESVYSLQPAECLFKVFGYSSWISYHAVWCQLNLCVLSWDFSKTIYLCLRWNHLAIHKRNLILGSMYFCCYDQKWYLFKGLVEKHMCCFTLVLCIFFCFRQNQVVLLETLEQEISKFKECNSILDINALVSTVNAFLNFC